MKKRLKEMEEEAVALREMQAKVEKEMGAVQGQIIIIVYFLGISCFRVLVRLIGSPDLLVNY